jgi:poly(A) polymerase
MRVARLKRFLARPTIADELALHKVDCQSSNGDLSNYEFLKHKIEEFSHEPLIPPPLLTGNDLMRLGFQPGPQFKTILEAVQSAQLEGVLTTPSDAESWVKANFQP